MPHSSLRFSNPVPILSNPEQYKQGATGVGLLSPMGVKHLIDDRVTSPHALAVISPERVVGLSKEPTSISFPALAKGTLTIQKRFFYQLGSMDVSMHGYKTVEQPTEASDKTEF